MFFQIGIVNSWFAAGSKRIGHANNDEATALRSVENAGPVAEAASLVAKLAQLSVFEVEGENRLNGLRYFLAIGADILYRSAAHASGDSAQTLDTRAVAGDGAGDELVPLFPRANLK